MLEAVFDNAIVIDPPTADFVLKNCMDVDNPLVYLPNTGDACLNVCLHAKFKAITQHCYIGNVELVDLRTKTSYNYIDDDINYEYLPSMDTMLDGIKFNEVAWWFRDDISTYDGSAKDAEEYDIFMEEHFENTQIAVTEPFMKIEDKDNNIEQALRVLKRKLQRDGFFKVIKLKNTYEKPSEKKKRILQENIKRVKKLNKLKNRI